MRDEIHEFDIVAGYKHKRTDKYTLYSIEVKMTNFTQAFIQGNVRRIWFDYCYIAFPLRKMSMETLISNFGKNFQDLKKFGIGVLFYDEIEGNVFKVLNATKDQFPPHKDLKQKIINKLWDLEVQEKPFVAGPSILDFIPELKKSKKVKNKV